MLKRWWASNLPKISPRFSRRHDSHEEFFIVSKRKDDPPTGEKHEPPPPSASGSEKVQMGGWDDSSVRVKSRAFPGPAGVSEPLRIAMTKEAYADLIGHAKESLDREICGVLLGDLCEDEHGFFVAVQATVRGAAAKTGGTHVTFTQETWNEIHKEKEARYRKLQIVGWYHSHPGFGVEFSDMDMFIQKNFFSGPSQIAFVSDPLGGEEAICANTDLGIKNIRRFWVDGRERRCYVPPEAAAHADGNEGPSGAPMAGGDLAKTIHELEDRVRQLTDAVEKQRNSFYSLLTFIGMLAAICFLGATGYSIYRSYRAPLELPQIFQESSPMAMKIDGKDVLVSLVAKKWNVPREWNMILVPAEDLLKMQEALKKEEEAATQAASKPATQPASAASNPAGQ
jgi:proteasome lid subunit RPN8/RPN11